MNHVQTAYKAVDKIVAENQRYKAENERLKKKLAIKKHDREMSCKQVATRCDVNTSTVWRWKKEGLKDTPTGKIMYSDLIDFLCDKKKYVAKKLGFNPEDY